MENLSITYQTLLAIAAFIIAIGGAGAVIAKVLKPFQKIKERIKNVEDHQENDYNRLDDLEKGSKAMCRATLGLIDHLLTGNGDEKLCKARDALDNYLVEK